MSVFHTYDVRGQYPDQIDEEFARELGNAYARYLDGDTVVIGYDARDCSEQLHDAVIDGLRDAGIDVTTAGLVSTPLICWLVQRFDGGVAVTASHNPPGYGGFKLYDGDGDGIGMGRGLDEIRDAMSTYHTIEQGVLNEQDFTDEYATHLSQYAPETERRILVDTSNGSAGPYVQAVLKQADVPYDIVNETPDGNFPNHSPNPLMEESQETVKQHVGDYAFGVIFDADGDRAVFVDSNGDVLKASSIIAVQARHLYDHGTIVLDALNYRASVVDAIEQAGLDTKPTQVGYVHIREGLKDGGTAGAEYSGHFSHAETNSSDNSILAVLKTLHCVEKAESGLHELTKDLEDKALIQVNFEVDDKDGAVSAVDDAVRGESVYIDGVSKRLSDTWLNVRKSNTEPVIRVTIEARDRDRAETMLDRIMEIIQVDEVHSRS